jgi:dimethylargininase
MAMASRRIAITRELSESISRCELTHIAREPIDVGLAREQHCRYEARLADLGCVVHRLPEEPELPDAVFVEDTAVVLDEVAIVTRPGAASRRPEVPSVARALASYRRLVTIRAPGTLDGGDVVRVGRRLFVGLSRRTNPTAVEQLEKALVPLGYRVTAVPVAGCLHLKSAVTQVGEDRLLINRDWVDERTFAGVALIDVDPSEPYAANALLVGAAVIYPSRFAQTRRRLEGQGIDVRTVDLSELQKAEGAVTCCSLIVGLR